MDKKSFMKEIKNYRELLSDKEYMEKQRNAAKFRRYAKENDLILIKNKDDFQKIIKWGYDNSIWLTLDPSPINQGSILLYPILTEEDNFCTRISFNCRELVTDIEVYRFPFGLLGKDIEEDLILKFQYIRNRDIDNQFSIQYVKDNDLIDTQRLQGIRQLLFSALFFLLYFSETRYIEKKKVTFNKQKKKKKGKTKSFRQMGKINYEIVGGSNLEETLNEDTEKRQYDRHTDSWTRRGHFRTITRKDGTSYQKWIQPSVCRAKTPTNENKKTERGLYKP